jgi:hypothetical protein
VHGGQGAKPAAEFLPPGVVVHLAVGRRCEGVAEPELSLLSDVGLGVGGFSGIERSFVLQPRERQGKQSAVLVVAEGGVDREELLGAEACFFDQRAGFEPAGK